VRGSFVGTRKDMAECLDFAAKGKVKADIELQPLSSINKVLERLEHGDVPSRVVLDFTDTKSEKTAGATAEAVRADPVLA
jgi:propanol-preferring alcohol dehydrogenase